MPRGGLNIHSRYIWISSERRSVGRNELGGGRAKRNPPPPRTRRMRAGVRVYRANCEDGRSARARDEKRGKRRFEAQGMTGSP